MTGINVAEAALLSAADLEHSMGDCAALGFKCVRFEVSPLAQATLGWGSIEAVKASATKHGLGVLPVLGVHPTAGYTAAAFGIFCGQAARFLQNDRYEIWNEPNLEAFWAKGSPETFAAYLNAAYDAIKRVQPDAVVLVGGLAACVSASGWFIPQFPFFRPWTNVHPVVFLTRLYLAKAKFDGVCYHPYSLTPGFVEEEPSPSEPMIAAIADLRALMNRNHDSAKPIVLSEWGFSTGGAATVARRAEAEWDLLPYESFFYQLRDYLGAFGLEDANFKAKPGGLVAWVKAKLGK